MASTTPPSGSTTSSSAALPLSTHASSPLESGDSISEATLLQLEAQEERREWMHNQIRHFVAGFAARASAATIMFPVDTVKTRLQFSSNNASKSVRRTYTSAGETFSAIWREEGARGFFRGLPVRLVYISPSAAVSFTLYEHFKYLLKSKHGVDLHSISIYNPIVPFVAGGMARVIGTACRTPFDIVKQRMQVQGTLKEAKYRSAIQAFRSVVFEEGFTALWAGYRSALLRDVPFAAIYFCSYEGAKFVQLKFAAPESSPLVEVRRRGDGAPRKRLSIINHLISGAFAGSIAATCTIPFDVVKTKLQTQATLPPEERKYTGIAQAFRRVYQEEGAKGFVRGLGPRLLYLTPAASLTFAFYEKYKQLLGATSD